MQLRIHPKMKWEGFSNWPTGMVSLRFFGLLDFF